MHKGAAQPPGPAWKGAFLSERSFSSQRTAGRRRGVTRPQRIMELRRWRHRAQPAPHPPPSRAGVGGGGKGRLGKLVGSGILAATLAMALWADSEGKTQPRTWDFPQRPLGICESSRRLPRDPGPVILSFCVLAWLPCGCGKKASPPEPAQSFSSVLPSLPGRFNCFLTSRPCPSSPGPSW